MAAAAANAVTDIFPTSWEMTKGVVKVLNPVNIVTHLAGTNDDLVTRPTTLVGVTVVSDDVGDAAASSASCILLAVLNVFVGVFNMFPLLPLDGGHAAIATYERLRERNGQRYHADVAKMMPFAMAVITMLMFLFARALPRHHPAGRLTGDHDAGCRLDHRAAQDPSRSPSAEVPSVAMRRSRCSR